MTTSVHSPQPTQENEVEVIKDLETRGIHGIETLSLEELQLLTERKRKQLQLEAAEKKAQLESEIASVEQHIQELSAKKVALTEELDAHLKSMGLPNGADRSARRSPRKNQKAAETPPSPVSES